MLPEPVVVARLRAAGCVFAEDEARLLLSEAKTGADLESMLDRRVSGLPLEHVLGWAEFCGLRIAVDPGVFVPRRRTEFLVEQAVELAPVRACVVDVCCGSGALGVALLAGLSGAELHAADIDPVACRCARRNVGPVGGHVYEGDLFDPLPDSLRGRVDIVVANVPYVPSDAISRMPPEARLHEPRAALDGGPDGLTVLRRVSAEAARWLAPGGHLLVETSERQVPLALEILSAGGLVPRIARSEDGGAVVAISTLPRPAGSASAV